jgi:hypothetical protein
VNSISIKDVRRIYKAVLINFIKSLRTKQSGKVIVNSIIPEVIKVTNRPKETVMNFIQCLSDAGLLPLDKESYTKADDSAGAIDWMVTPDFKDTEDLYTMERATSKQNVTVSNLPEITKDSHILSQRAWRYEHKEQPQPFYDILTWFQDTRYSFRDGVTEADIREAVLDIILDSAALSRYNSVLAISGVEEADKTLQNWQVIEIARYILEFQRIMEHGNSFVMKRFLDSANRVYDETMFKFQTSSKLKDLLRFADTFSYSKEDWDEVKHACVVTQTGKFATQPKRAVAYYNKHHKEMLAEYGDSKGYHAAISRPNEPTNIILFIDATTQGTQLYGAITADSELLLQGGAQYIEDLDSFEKAYAKLATELNDALTEELNDPLAEEFKVINCFTNDNVKSLHMTSLYNVGKNRILTGKGFKLTEDEASDSWELDIEYETSSSKLGKLQPLLKTVREAGLSINQDRLFEIFQRVLNKIAREAIRAMKDVNNLVCKRVPNKTIYEWQSIDGVWNQYAMTKQIKTELHWVTNKGHEHQLAYHETILEAQASWRGVAPRWIQSIDAWLVRFMGRKCQEAGYPLALIHDSYGAPASAMKQIREWYREALCIIVDEDLLNKFTKDLTGYNRTRSIQLGKDIELIKRGIKASTLALMY